MRVVRDRKNRTASMLPMPAFVPLLVLLPDLSAFVGDNALAWTVWLALTQASMALLCLLAVIAPKTYAMKVSFVGAVLWYATQALDEAVAGNVFADSAMEYVVFLIYTSAIGIHLYGHERQQRNHA